MSVENCELPSFQDRRRTPQPDRPTHLDGTVVDVEAEADSLMEGGHGFARAVDVQGVLRTHVPVFMVDRRFYHSVSDGLWWYKVRAGERHCLISCKSFKTFHVVCCHNNLTHGNHK